MREAGREVVAAADIAKLSEDELALISGSPELLDGARAAWHPGMRLLAVTQGQHGAVLFTRDECVAIPGFAVETVDTVGCGDAFLAALLCGLLDSGADGRAALERIGLRACAAGALAATRAGGMASLPTAAAVDRSEAGAKTASDGRPTLEIARSSRWSSPIRSTMTSRPV